MCIYLELQAARREIDTVKKKYNPKFLNKLKKKALWVRRSVLDMCITAGAGHIAPALSCTEILIALYQGGILRVRPRNPEWKKRDRFILSKGQGCAALYAVLADLGFFPTSVLNTYTCFGSRLGGHSESNVPGVEAFTGSLGHGLAIAAGMALAAKIDKKPYLSVVLLGDGECQEGSIWESAMFAGYHCLSNLIAIIDRNRLQAINFTKKVLCLEPLSKKWEAFGWDVEEVDGHCLESLLNILSKIRSRKSSKPLVIIATTTKGKGISFMENKSIWHYRIPQGNQLETAKKEISG